MKHLGAVLTFAAFTLFAAMNTLVLLRERDIANLDKYRAGVTSFLGNELFRERWMSIHKRDGARGKDRRIGYSGYTIEKTFALEGVEIVQTMESRVEIEPFGKLDLAGTLVADKDMKPVSLRGTVSFANQPRLEITGERKQGKFLLSLKAGFIPFPATELPLEELHLGDMFVPTLPIAGFHVGDSFHVPCFDPITRTRDTAAVNVVSRQVLSVNGPPVDAYCLETAFRGLRSKSWVTEAGELLVQELGPPLEDVYLKRTTRAEIRREEKTGDRSADARKDEAR